MRLLAVFALCMAITISAVAETSDTDSFLSLADPSLWQEETFKGHTGYQVIQEKDGFSLEARCEGTASALYRRIPVDLTKTPILRWSWKIDGIHAGLDDVSKEGDDYAARVYVVYKGKLPWDINAVNYVWANKQPQGRSWPNAYTGRAMMIAQESGMPEDSGVWIEESRNVREDFKRYFDRNFSRIDGIAVMTDCDNGGGTATGHYRDIRFTAEE